MAQLARSMATARVADQTDWPVVQADRATT
jgi:hypothetical protein